MKRDPRPLDGSLVRELVREELRRMFARVFAPEPWSTRAGCAPPGYSREAWAAVAKTIGVKRGRYWVVTPEALDEHERGNRDAQPANDSARPWDPSMSREARRGAQ
jgi:hypothetical protein